MRALQSISAIVYCSVVWQLVSRSKKKGSIRLICIASFGVLFFLGRKFWCSWLLATWEQRKFYDE
jgi:hypothetical protein